MAIYSEENIQEETVLAVAKQMFVAARTAPKAKGVDNISICIVTKEDIIRISNKMEEYAKEGQLFFGRDAKNILHASAILLIGTKIKSLNLPQCGLCGFANCEEKNKHPKNPCSFNTGDLGVALGSAVSIASKHQIDNRIMYTIGIAARELGFFDNEVRIIYGIPLSATSKNPFFDRK